MKAEIFKCSACKGVFFGNTLNGMCVSCTCELDNNKKTILVPCKSCGVNDHVDEDLPKESWYCKKCVEIKYWKDRALESDRECDELRAELDSMNKNHDELKEKIKEFYDPDRWDDEGDDPEPMF